MDESEKQAVLEYLVKYGESPYRAMHRLMSLERMCKSMGYFKYMGYWCKKDEGVKMNKKDDDLYIDYIRPPRIYYSIPRSPIKPKLGFWGWFKKKWRV